MKVRNSLLGGVALLLFAATAVPMQAQIFRYFTSEMGNEQYTSLPLSRTPLAVEDFVDPATRLADPDNGYYYKNGRFGVDLGFTFEYEGQRYTRIQINVNGFVLFGNQPPLLASNIPTRLFNNAEPNTVIAPFWGEHYYRGDNQRDQNNQLFLESEIAVMNQVSANGVNNFVVEWRDLNINYFFDANNPEDPLSPDASVKRSSVGTFQLKLFESAPVGQPKQFEQGDIEFHYSTVGDPQVPGAVKTSGSSVGIESHPFGQAPTSFMNGLFIESEANFINRDPNRDTPENSRNRTDLTSTWSPSRANNNVIRFVATPRQGIRGWGDGDANLSQLPGNQHFLKPQNEFVTVTDPLTIMRSVVEFKPLDSLLEREAYHGDVNHNGRYFYSTRDENNDPAPRYRRDVPTRSANEFDDIPADNSFIPTQLFFEANSYDAALIINYMAGRVPVLPWRLDTTVAYGKAGAAQPFVSGVELNDVRKIADQTYLVPVTFTGNVNGAVGVEMDFDGVVTNIEAVEANGNKVLAVNGQSIISIAASGTFNTGDVLAYATVRTAGAVLRAENVEVNDVNKGSIEIPVGVDASTANVYPNPFTERVEFAFNITVAGDYSLRVFDILGNVVKDFGTQTMSEGTQVIEWNGLDADGKQLANGSYVYRLEGANGVQSGSVSVAR